MNSTQLSRPHDDRPETIHSWVCGAVFVGLFALFRLGHVPDLLAAGMVLLLAFPLMGWLAPLSLWLYVRFARGEKKRETVKTSDAGCATLVFLFFVFIAWGVWQGKLAERQQSSQILSPHGAPLANPRAK